MKKLLFSVAILAVAASCSKSEVTDVAPSTQNAIGFSTLNDRVTKVANVNAADASGTTTNSDYTVYSAYDYAGATETAWYINGETVDSKDAMTTEYYWPTTVANTLAFYAYAPVAGTDLTVSPTSTSAIDLTFTVPSNAGIDFTIATPVTGAYCSSSDYSGADANGQVDLTFSHMLSKATMNVQLSEELAKEYEMVFTDVELTVDYNTVSASAITTPLAGTSSLMNGSSAGIVGTDEPTYTYTITDSSTAYATSFTGKQELMFAPQAASSAYSGIVVNGLTIRDTANDKTLVGPVNVSYTFDADQAFVVGTAYQFTITLDADHEDLSLITITFESDNDAWDTPNGVTID